MMKSVSRTSTIFTPSRFFSSSLASSSRNRERPSDSPQLGGTLCREHAQGYVLDLGHGKRALLDALHFLLGREDELDTGAHEAVLLLVGEIDEQQLESKDRSTLQEIGASDFIHFFRFIDFFRHPPRPQRPPEALTP